MLALRDFIHKIGTIVHKIQGFGSFQASFLHFKFDLIESLEAFCAKFVDPYF